MCESIAQALNACQLSDKELVLLHTVSFQGRLQTADYKAYTFFFKLIMNNSIKNKEKLRRAQARALLLS